MATTVDRLLPTEEAEALLELTRELATKELAPQVHDAEEKGEFPAAAYALLGKSGLMSLPFGEELGGAGSRTRCTSRSSRRSPPSGRASRSG
jgi:alkylation response protein AidB-like acyl-CoA dehydrogenase